MVRMFAPYRSRLMGEPFKKDGIVARLSAGNTGKEKEHDTVRSAWTNPVLTLTTVEQRQGVHMGIRECLKNGPLGFGAAPLGNMFRDIPDAEAEATVRAAWTAGTRFFDTAPFYGASLSEIRLGKELNKHKRSKYILSSKVGRLILDKLEQDAQTFGEKATFSSTVIVTRSCTTTRKKAPCDP
jgi:Aldo/keto reductase family